MSWFNFRGPDQQKRVSRPLGRRAEPAAPGQAPALGRQRPPAGRADERPRRRHAARARGRAARLCRLRRGHLARPLVPGSHRDARPRLRGRLAGHLVRGLVGRVRRTAARRAAPRRSSRTGSSTSRSSGRSPEFYAPYMICPSCGTENEPGRRFCGECGAKLALVCASCGGANTPGTKFCGDCGAALAAGAPILAPAPTPEAERRLVSVLFADLVGSRRSPSHRDPEEVRELLSRYFDTPADHRPLRRHGGEVHRRRRDGGLGRADRPGGRRRAGRPGRSRPGRRRVRARAGPGDASVGVAHRRVRGYAGRRGQGMVAGDLVNTASRIQSAASRAPSWWATAPSGAAGRDRLRGHGRARAEGQGRGGSLWRALRVVATRGGEGRSPASRPPSSAATESSGSSRSCSTRRSTRGGASRLGRRRGRHRQVAPRMGVREVRRRSHRRHPLAPRPVPGLRGGRGVLGARRDGSLASGILEDEAPAPAPAKLRSTVERFVPDAEERAWIEPRLRHLLGLTESTAPDQRICSRRGDACSS